PTISRSKLVVALTTVWRGPGGNVDCPGSDWDVPFSFTGGIMTALKTTARNKLEGKAFAFPEQRKEPLENAAHVRNAVSRFDQVEGVSDTERDAAWKR